jgi:MOSC domain-containing protein YiiM
MLQGKVYAVCISEAKGTPKKEVPEALLVAGHGIQGDAHAGDWHRQVSLLSEDKVERFRKTGIDVDNGAFGENILVTGIDPVSLVVGTKVRIGESLLEITQIGKECHTRCRIYNTVGDCIMPREGVFAKVLEGGPVKRGDAVYVD